MLASLCVSVAYAANKLSQHTKDREEKRERQRVERAWQKGSTNQTKCTGKRFSNFKMVTLNCLIKCRKLIALDLHTKQSKIKQKIFTKDASIYCTQRIIKRRSVISLINFSQCTEHSCTLKFIWQAMQWLSFHQTMSISMSVSDPTQLGILQQNKRKSMK